MTHQPFQLSFFVDNQRHVTAAAIASEGNVISYCTFATTLVCSLLILGIIRLKKGATIKNYLCFNPVPQKVYFYWIACLISILLTIGLHSISNLIATLETVYVLAGTG